MSKYSLKLLAKIGVIRKNVGRHSYFPEVEQWFLEIFYFLIHSFIFKRVQGSIFENKTHTTLESRVAHIAGVFEEKWQS